MVRKTTAVKVPNVKHPGAWLGRYVVLEGSCIDGDGGCESAIGKVRAAQAVGRDRLEFEIMVDEDELRFDHEEALDRGDFAVTPYAFGHEGIPSHLEIRFNGTPATNQQKGGNSMEKFFVNPQRNHDPAPLVMNSLEDEVRKARGLPVNEAEPPKRNTGGVEPLVVPNLVEAIQATNGDDDTKFFKELRQRIDGENTPIDKQVVGGGLKQPSLADFLEDGQQAPKTFVQGTCHKPPPEEEV